MIIRGTYADWGEQAGQGREFAGLLKKMDTATDAAEDMRYLVSRLAPVLIATATLGCSSKSSNSADAAHVSEAGAIDTGKSDGRRTDGSVSEAGGSRDGKPVDVAGHDAASIDGARDASREATVKLDGGARKDAADPDAPPPTGTCDNPIEILASVTHADFVIDTTGVDHVIESPCANNSSDIVFKIQTNERDLVYVDTFGSGVNTSLFFSESCTEPQLPEATGMVTCSDDACGTAQSQLVATLDYGNHYLIVSGVNDEGGPVTVHFLRSPVGNGPLVALPQGAGVLSGTTDGIDSTRTCDTSGPKNSYWWATCPTDVGGDFRASTCQGATWDTYLFFQAPRADVLACADDDQACGTLSTLNATIPPEAGLYVLTVTGGLLRSYGDYSLTYSRP